MTFSHHVYILKCSDGHFYVGCTNDLDDRIAPHMKGMVHFTKDKLPVECIASFAFADKYKAFAFEKYLMRWSGKTGQEVG